MTSDSLPDDLLGPVSPLGVLCFNPENKIFRLRGKTLRLGPAASRVLWRLVKSPAGVPQEILSASASASGTLNSLHKAVFDIREAIGKGGVVLEDRVYRINAGLFQPGGGVLPFEERLAKLRACRGIPIAQFLELLWSPDPDSQDAFCSESLLCSRDPLTFVRQNAASVFASSRSYLLIAPLREADRLAGTLATLYEGLRESARIPASHPGAQIALLDNVRRALTIVFAAHPVTEYCDPVYIVNSHSQKHALRFTMTRGGDEAVFLDHGDHAFTFGDSLRSQFLPFEGEGIVRWSYGSKPGDAEIKMQAAIRQAFRRFGSEELTEKALHVCFEIPVRQQPASETHRARAARAAEL